MDTTYVFTAFYTRAGLAHSRPLVQVFSVIYAASSFIVRTPQEPADEVITSLGHPPGYSPMEGSPCAAIRTWIIHPLNVVQLSLLSTNQKWLTAVHPRAERYWWLLTIEEGNLGPLAMTSDVRHRHHTLGRECKRELSAGALEPSWGRPHCECHTYLAPFSVMGTSK